MDDDAIHELHLKRVANGWILYRGGLTGHEELSTLVFNRHEDLMKWLGDTAWFIGDDHDKLIGQGEPSPHD